MRLADVIESLDRPRLADAMRCRGGQGGAPPTLLIEVNVGNEAQKAGVPRAEADAFIDACRARFGSPCKG